MKVTIKEVISKTDINRLRKQRQVKAKKQAKRLKQFRRIKEDTSTDKLHQDLADSLLRVIRINKKFKSSISTDFSDQDLPLVKVVQELLRTIDGLVTQSIDILNTTVPLEISEHISNKNRKVNRLRGYI